MKKWLESIFSDGSIYFVSNPTPKKGEEITIYLRAYVDSPIDCVFLRRKIHGVENLVEMEKHHVVGNLQYYACNVVINEPVFNYHFYIGAYGDIYYYNQLEITDVMPDEVYDFRIVADYVQPSWVKNAVFYQIFPERFCNGNKANDVKTGEFSVFGNESIHIDDWNAIPKEYEEAHCLDFYGGDLEGIIQKIPYLKKLGVSALYLNPIFKATSVHHYDCIDFFHVDEHLGGDEALAELTDKLHKNDMRLMLDVSINHTGTNHKWFNKEGLYFDKSVGAYNNPDSKERGFYFFDGNEYKGWLDVPTLPTLNYKNEELRKIIYKDNNSVVKKWLKEPYNIDAWRFDVADTMARYDDVELHHVIWPEIKKSIRAEKSDAYVIGEDWCDCSQFLKGDEWDSSMNYFGFTRPVREFAGDQDIHNRRKDKLISKNRMTAKGLSRRILQHLAKLPFVIQENQFNLLGSHDCSRLHNENISFDHYRGAVIMLFTMIGATNIYYGDEASIDGRVESMEGCRYPMPWDKDIEKSLNYGLYYTLAQLKKNCEAFRGSFMEIQKDDYVYSYARFTDKEVIVAIISMDDEERTIKIPAYALLKEPHSIDEDLLGLKVESYVDNDYICVKTRPNTSYLLKL